MESIESTPVLKNKTIPISKSNAITNFINLYHQYRNSSKNQYKIDHKIQKFQNKLDDKIQKSKPSENIKVHYDTQLKNQLKKYDDLNKKIGQDHNKGLGQDIFDLRQKQRQKQTLSRDINDTQNDLNILRTKIDNNLFKQNVFKEAIRKQHWKKQDLEKELESNPFMKTDKFIRAHQTGIKAALAVPVVGGTIYGGKKVVDHLTTPLVVTTKPALTVAPTALPPAAPPDIKPPPNHFSDNASKYGAALGGVAAAGLGALALRRYIKKKKEK